MASERGCETIAKQTCRQYTQVDAESMDRRIRRQTSQNTALRFLSCAKSFCANREPLCTLSLLGRRQGARCHRHGRRKPSFHDSGEGHWGPSAGDRAALVGGGHLDPVPLLQYRLQYPAQRKGPGAEWRLASAQCGDPPRPPTKPNTYMTNTTLHTSYNFGTFWLAHA